MLKRNLTVQTHIWLIWSPCPPWAFRMHLHNWGRLITFLTPVAFQRADIQRALCSMDNRF